MRKGIDLQNQIFQPLIPCIFSIGFQQTKKTFILCFIKGFKQFSQHIFLQQSDFRWVCRFHCRVNIQSVIILPNNLQAKSVNGFDVCPTQIGELVLQMDIIRLFFQFFCNGSTDSLAHFCRCRFCKRHHQQTVNIQRVFFCCNPLNDTLHQYGCFAAACRRRNKDIASSGVNGFFLLCCPLCSHAVSPHLFLRTRRLLQPDMKRHIPHKRRHKATVRIIPEVQQKRQRLRGHL